MAVLVCQGVGDDGLGGGDGGLVDAVAEEGDGVVRVEGVGALDC